MTARAFLALILAWASSALGDDVDAWVKGKVSAQRSAHPSGITGPLWTDAPRRGLTGFQPPSSLAPLVRAVRPGVVNISAHNEGASKSLGSGFVINADGLIVTNNHVVDRAREIAVRLSDGRTLGADVLGRDPSTDLALLRVHEAKGLPIVALGDSDALEVGDWIVAIGNPFGFETSVTHGLISARERVLGMGPFDDFLQTNALVNPGNSGGPLFDMKGSVVGVTTAIVSQGQGIGFAVPINLVKELIPSLLDHGRRERGWLGIGVQDEESDDGRRTVFVTEVRAGSPAQRAGLRVGDRVAKVGGHAVQRYQQLLRRVALLAPGTALKLEVERGANRHEVTAVLAERPAAQSSPTMAASNAAALGLTLAPAGAEPGLRVAAVTPSSPAETAGLTAGDVLVEVNGEPVRSTADVEAALARAVPGEDVLLRLRRGNSLRYVAVRPP